MNDLEAYASDTAAAASTPGDLEALFLAFQARHPEIVEAMAVMNLSFPDYLEALAALEEPSLITSDHTLR